MSASLWTTLLVDGWLLTSQCCGEGVDEVRDLYDEFLNFICVGCGERASAMRTFCLRPSAF